MRVCKFQSDVTGSRVIFYDKSKELFGEIEGELAEVVMQAVGLTAPLQRRFAMAEKDKHGILSIGDRMPEQDWYK